MQKSILALVLAVSAFMAQAAQPVALPDNGATRLLKGTIRGDARADYVFTAPAGRRLRADLKTSNASAYFNLNQEGNDAAIFIGAQAGNSMDIVLPATGTYRISVYLMRNAARRNAQARYEMRLR